MGDVIAHIYERGLTTHSLSPLWYQRVSNEYTEPCVVSTFCPSFRFGRDRVGVRPGGGSVAADG